MVIGGDRAPIHVRRAAGFSVHLFTASGSAVALLALFAAIDRDFSACFAWLGVALIIDGVDGTLARAAKVSETASAIDGVVLDLVIDFLTYVLVPMVALWRSDLMPVKLSFWLSVIVVFASGLYFADTRMKTKDYWFRGFPALWNVVALYLFVLRPPWLVSAALILAGTGAMFAPVVFVHPMRVKELRVLNLVASVAFFRAVGGGDLARVCAKPLGEARLRDPGRLFPGAAVLAPFALGGRLGHFAALRCQPANKHVSVSPRRTSPDQRGHAPTGETHNGHQGVRPSFAP